MNKVFLLLAFSMAALGVSAQQRAVYGEFNGASFGYSVHFDSRLSPKSKWGYNVGLGYANNVLDNPHLTQQRLYSLPLRMYYLVGKKNHFFESGIGVVPCFFHTRATYSSTNTQTNPAISQFIKSSSTDFVNYVTLSLAYRYQNSNGFIVRAGLTANGVQHSDSKTEMWGFQPFVAVGYSF